MLIEQIIEFELRGCGPPGRICALITGYFYGKTKIFKANLWVDYYLLLKVLHETMYLTWAKSQNLIPKCTNLNVF